MIYIFAPSYQSFFFSLHQFPNDEIIFVTYNPAIKEFAEKTGFKVIYRELQTDLSVNGYKNYKQHCLDMVSDWKDRDILFCFYFVDVWSLYQLLELKKRNRVYFYNVDYLSAQGFDDQTSIKVPIANNPLFNLANKAYRKILFRKLLLKYITKVSFDIFQFEKQLFYLGLSLQRCKKLFLPYTKKTNEDIFINNRRAILNKINLPEIDILFIGGGESNGHYTPQLLETITAFVKQNNLRLYTKPHPTLNLAESLSSFPQIDRKIPIELLIGIPKMVMGISSFSLISFSKTAPTISLINLITYENKENGERFKNMLKETKEISMPATINELLSQLNKF